MLKDDESKILGQFPHLKHIIRDAYSHNGKGVDLLLNLFAMTITNSL